MVKYLKYFIFLTLLASIKLEYDGKCKGSASTLSECEDLLLDVEKELGDHCCLFKAKSLEKSTYESQCLIVDEEGYHNMNDFKAQYENLYDDIKIDCKSYYLYLGIFYLLIILI